MPANSCTQSSLRISSWQIRGAFLADPSLIFHTGDSMIVDGGYTIF